MFVDLKSCNSFLNKKILIKSKRNYHKHFDHMVKFCRASIIESKVALPDPCDNGETRLGAGSGESLKSGFKWGRATHLSTSHPSRRKPMSAAMTVPTRGIQLSENALRHVLKLRESQGKDLCLRVGVRQGGCSGMSYMMDFEDPSQINAQDEVFDYDGFKIVCDPKSLLYLYGLMLDYSDAMIGGGFQFTNPNANQTCGCGKSFGV
jgi:iron-sulfur cluster assembly protein